jgi:hypothetical protein
VAISNSNLNKIAWSASIDRAGEWLTGFAELSEPEPRSSAQELFVKSRAAAKGLIETLNDFKPKLTQDRTATFEEYKSLLDGIDRFHNICEQEFEDLQVRLIAPIGAYHLKTLTDDAEMHLSNQAQKVLDAKTKRDFAAAGTCLAYDLFTASGFHAMRAVEAVARKYHRIVTNLETALQNIPLSPIINERKDFVGLRKQWEDEGSKNDSPLGLIISTLSHVNSIYRNPIMHPEMVLTYDLAKQVFDISAIAISEMVADGCQRAEEKKEKTTAGGIAGPVTVQPD